MLCKCCTASNYVLIVPPTKNSRVGDVECCVANVHSAEHHRSKLVSITIWGLSDNSGTQGMEYSEPLGKL